jgi:hypothetical protein
MAEDVGALPEQRYQASLAALEAELALNLLTDGWFSTRQAESYLGVRRAASAAMAQ